MSNATVDYTRRHLTLYFEGEVHNFDLNKGDTGDFWHSFESKGAVKDLNFYLDEDSNKPFLTVYGTTSRNGLESTDTTNAEDIFSLREVGKVKEYIEP